MEWLVEYRAYWLSGLVVVGALLAFKGLQLALIFRAVWTTPFAEDRVALADPDEIPPQERAIIEPDAAALRDLGFVEECALATDLRAPTGATRVHSFVYRHPETKTYVALRANREAWIKLACLSSFVNYLSHGRHIETASHDLYAIPSLPRRIEVEAPLFASAAERWVFHRGRLSGLTDEALTPTPEEGIALGRALCAEIAEHLRRLGILREDPNRGALRYTLRGAWAVTRATLAEIRRWRRFNPQKAPTLSPEQEALAFEHAQMAEDGRRLGRLGKLVLLVGSAALFSLAFGVAFNWELAGMLLIVVLLHEGGHFLAMKSFGYRDLSIFFVPLLGAATLGHKADATPGQKLWVYLAGPVPGLVLGALALVAGLAAGNSTLLTFAIVALVVNLLNLLPISPLDGGRILEVLWLERFPRVRVGFLVLSAGGLGALAMLAQDFILGGFALLLLLFLPGEWRFARLIDRLRAEARRAGPVSLPRVFAQLRELYPTGTKAFERHAIAKRAVEALQARAPGLAMALSGTLVYLASFALPIGFAAVLLAWPTQYLESGWRAALSDPVPGPAAPDWEAAFHGAATPEDQWRVLQEAGDWYLEQEDGATATAYFDRALAAAGALPDGRGESARSLVARASAAEEVASALADYRAAVGLLAEPEPGDAPTQAAALEGIADTDAGLTAEQRAELYAQAIALYPQGPTSSVRLTSLRARLAQLLDQGGRVAEAEAVLRAGIIEPAPDGTPDFATATLRVQLGWFLIAHGRSAEAISLLAPAVREAPMGSSDGEALTALAWAYHGAGRYAAALDTLERVPRPPALLPFLGAELPLPAELDRVAGLKAANDPGLADALAALGRRLDEQGRRRYLEQTALRMQYAPWQALRWRAHQDVLKALAQGPAQHRAGST
ncbi:MAG: hypothetical protein MUC77_12405 [Chromatiaceae bacterium]|jgi:Zn-dependent protease|nr:hypothetical protein [Chromatiaceae bacterium]